MKTPLVAALTSLAVLAAALLGYIALRTMVDAKSVAVLALHQEITSKTAATARLASVREELAARGEVASRVEAYFVPEEGVVNLIDELQARGSAVGATVEINSVAASAPDKSGASVLNVALSITGSFDSVVRALGSIEYAPYDLSVTDLTLTYDTGKKTWLADATLSIGSAKGGTGAIGTPAPLPPPVPSATTTATSTKASKKI